MKVRFLHPAIGAFAVRLPTDGAMIVGRDGAEADIEITWDPQISRRHAKLWLEGDFLWLEDLGSRNGCWHGQTRLKGQIRLEAGSSVLIGETALLIPHPVTEPAPTDPAETFESPSPLGYAWAIADAATQPHTELAELDLFSEDIEVDLPMPSARELEVEAAPAPPPPPPLTVGEPAPRHDVPYFVTPSRVAVRADRAELARMWLGELSKGGLFVATDAPPPVGSQVQVRFDLDGNSLDLNAEVVAFVPGSGDGQVPAGVGLQLPELLGNKGATLAAFIEGRTADVPAANAKVPEVPPSPELGEALERSGKILTLSEQNKLYAAVDVAPESEPFTIESKISGLLKLVQGALPGALPPQAARLEAAVTALERARRILGRPDSRLDYDFRAGYVRAQARIEAARESRGPDVASLRRAWNRVHASKIEQAARLTRQAFQARQEHDLDKAVLIGERALEMNPFFEELEKTVDVWRRLARGGDAAAGDPPPG